MILVFNKHVRLSKLADELLQNGLISPVREDGTSAIQSTEMEVIIYVPDDTSQEIINQIEALISSHDPTSQTQPQTTEERLAELEILVMELSLEGGETNMSWFNLYKRLYDRGDMTVEQLQQAVEVGRITPEEYEEITGEPYPEQ